MLTRKMAAEEAYPANGVGTPPAPFVVGHARSGTTLLRLMLDAHPDLAIPKETQFIPQVVRKCRVAADPRATFIETLTARPNWHRFVFPNDVFAEAIGRIDPFDLGEALRTFYRYYAARFNKPRWGDKSPGYLQNMSTIQEVLPEARFIHIVRDGRDVALSFQDLLLQADALGQKSLNDLASQWVLQLWQARAQVKDLRYYLEVRYEDLIEDAESVLRSICDFINLSWHPQMLQYHEQASERLTENNQLVRPPETSQAQKEWRERHTLLARPPQKERIAVWRREMDEADQKIIVETAGEALVEYGYPLT